MKKILFNNLVLVCLSAFSSALAAQATVDLYSLSLRFQPGTGTSLGANYRLDLTTDLSATELNGELAPLSSNSPQSHGSIYRLEGGIFVEPVFGNLAFNIPELTDANTNGISDFFEVNQAVAQTTTTGIFQDIQRNGTVSAVWSRPAGSNIGTCLLTFEEYDLTFNHNFEITQFRGLLNYATSSTNATGTVNLSQVGQTNRVLSGPVVFNPSASVTNSVILLAGGWTNETQQTLPYLQSDDLALAGQDYAGVFIFRDGNPTTSIEDFTAWLLNIRDPNDSNGNGIPDLSETSPAQPSQASLAISNTGTNLLFSIVGEIGNTHQIEQAGSLGLTNWVQTTSVTLTNTTHIIAVPFPTNSMSFWRLRSQ